MSGRSEARLAHLVKWNKRGVEEARITGSKLRGLEIIRQFRANLVSKTVIQ